MSSLNLRHLRNFWILSVATIILAGFSDAVAQASYQVTDLGTRECDVIGNGERLLSLLVGCSGVRADQACQRQDENVMMSIASVVLSFRLTVLVGGRGRPGMAAHGLQSKS